MVAEELCSLTSLRYNRIPRIVYLELIKPSVMIICLLILYFFCVIYYFHFIITIIYIHIIDFIKCTYINI